MKYIYVSKDRGHDKYTFLSETSLTSQITDRLSRHMNKKGVEEEGEKETQEEKFWVTSQCSFVFPFLQNSRMEALAHFL